MVRMCAKFIPKLLIVKQKNFRLVITQDNLKMDNKDENLFRKIITDDESWSRNKRTVFIVETFIEATTETSTPKLKQCNSLLIVFFLL